MNEVYEDSRPGRQKRQLSQKKRRAAFLFLRELRGFKGKNACTFFDAFAGFRSILP